MNRQEIESILSDITYKDHWEFRLIDLEREAGGWLFQIRFWEKCNVTGEEGLQSCRKWFISKHSSRNEVVRTVLKAVLVAEEHEIYEQFRYKGQMIFNPHVDYDALASFTAEGHEDTRTTQVSVVK